MKKINLKIGNLDKAKNLKDSGRYTAVISQIIDVGVQPGFENRAPQECIAIVFLVNGGHEVVKKVTLSDHDQSSLMEIVRAVGVVSQGDNDELELSDLVGKAIAVEVAVQGVFARIGQVCALEEFDDPVEPFDPKPICYVEDVETYLVGPDAKAFVMSLHRDVRRLLSSRIRNREM